jgi:uncharacterized peroxidase-related enzyme
MSKTIRLTILLALAVLMLNTSVFAGDKVKTDDSKAIKKAISRYPVPEFDKVPEDIQKIMLATKKRRGFIPNVQKALAHRPAEFRAFFTYAKALMGKKSGLTPAEKEMLIIATSSDNGCMYCVQSHGAALRIITKNPQISDQVAVNYHEADLTAREKAIIDFAMKVSNNSKLISDKDIEALSKHGLNREDALDIAGITAFFGLSNRMMNILKVRPDDQFYMMGRK